MRKNKKFIDPRYFMDEKRERIKEEPQTVMSEGWGRRAQVMRGAGLDKDEMVFVAQILNDTIDSLEFLDSPAYEKLFEYFAFSNEAPERMPYGTAKARDGMPDEWILDYLQGV